MSALDRSSGASVARAGGLPVALPHEAGLVADMIAAIDGLIVTGGAFDVDPALFGDAARHETVALKPGRTDFEMAITRAALDAAGVVLGRDYPHPIVEHRAARRRALAALEQTKAAAD